MTDKKSTSRIINEMSETMRGLDRCEARTANRLGQFKKGIKTKAQQTKRVNEATTEKSHTSI
jgi:hypothetical protein